MRIPSVPERTQDSIRGKNPAFWWGANAVDGTTAYWSIIGVGSFYYRVASGVLTMFQKLKNDQRSDDWVEKVGCIAQRISFSDFTDGGSTVGTKVLTATIPQGAWALQTVLENVTGFTGDVSATIQVGDGSDVDRYSTGTPSVFTTSNAIDLGAPSGTKIHTAAATVTVTITSNSDWGLVVAGAATLRIYYLH